MESLNHSFKLNRRKFMEYSALTSLAAYVAISPEHLALKALIPTISNDATSSSSSTPQETTIGTVHPPNCGGRCYLNMTVSDGRIVQISPGATPVIPAFQTICLRGLPEMQRIYSPDRIKYPMKQVGGRGSGNWQQISWEEAFNTVASAIQSSISKYGPQSVLFAGTVGSLPSLLNASTIIGGIDSGFPMGQDVTLGVPAGSSLSGKTSPEITSLINSKLIILWHNNMMHTTMTSSRFVFDAMESGAKLYVIDPRFSVTASKADWWIHPTGGGTDTALALGMLNFVIQNGLYDQNAVMTRTCSPLLVRRDTSLYLRQADVIQGGSKTTFMVYDASSSTAVPVGTSGATPALTGTFTINGIECDTALTLLTNSVQQYTPENVETITGVAASDVQKLATDYATLKPSYNGWGWNDKYYYSYNLARALATLAGITGQIGVPGGGVGVISHHWGSWPVNLGSYTLPSTAKTNAIPTIQLTTQSNPVRVMYCATNLIQQREPDFNKTVEWVKSLDFVVVADSFMTTSARYADIVLPINLFVESANFPHVNIISGTNGGRNFVYLTSKVIDPVFDSKLDIEIEIQLGNLLGFSSFYQNYNPDAIIEAQLKGGSDAFSKNALSGITLDALVANGGIMRFNVPLEGHVPFSPTSPIQTFNTPTGLIEFYNEVLIPYNSQLPVYNDDNEASRKSSLAPTYPLVLDQAHSKFRAHSTFANTPVLLELNPEPLVEINPTDASARGISSGDIVKVFNDRGYVNIMAKVNDAIQPGMSRIAEGWWINQFAEGTMNSLTNPAANSAHYVLSAKSPNLNFDDTRVEIQKVGGNPALVTGD